MILVEFNNYTEALKNHALLSKEYNIGDLPENYDKYGVTYYIVVNTGNFLDCEYRIPSVTHRLTKEEFNKIKGFLVEKRCK